MIDKITIEEYPEGLYLVRYGGLFAEMLTKDEVLGVVASALFSPHGPIFVHSYENEINREWSPSGRAFKSGPHKLLPPPRCKCRKEDQP